MEAIILAGGFGKRLKDRIGNVPKPMAPINNQPFLDYLLDYLIKNKIKRVILSVYYKYDLIKNHYGSSYKGMAISYSIDNTELGTGGAIKNALLITDDSHVFVINGDTYFNVNLTQLYNEHIDNNNDITFSLKPMTNFERYGFLETDYSGQVISFKKKKYCEYGTIDGGIYLIKRNVFNSIENRNQFSFNDFIINNLNDFKVGSFLCDGFFIDIGTPEDLEKAQKIFKNHL